jgi:Domain of unknown function (DUF5122) beta-propeller
MTGGAQADAGAPHDNQGNQGIRGIYTMTFRRRLLPAVGLAVAALSVAATSFAAPVGPAGSTPATGTPALSSADTNQYVRQLVPCGNTMYAVGTITTVTQKGVTYTRTGAFSFSATAPYTMTSWAPSINGTVNSIGFVGGNCSSAYLGGKFTTVNGTTVQNLAKVSTTTGTVDPTFKHTAAGQVNTVLGVNGHLFVGGQFSKVNGGANPYLASLNPTTGSDDGYLRLGISGNYQYPGVGVNPTRVYNQQLSHSGTKLLVEGDFTSVAALSRQQVFMLDLGPTSATLDPWNSAEFYVNCAGNEPFFLQDAAWSVDDQQVFVATTGYKPVTDLPTGPRSGLCDAAAAFPASPATVSHSWINYTGCDSLYAVAADASTVYVGGHERWASNGLSCDVAGPGAVAAPGMVGLSVSTGNVAWNPGRGRGKGADDMVVTDAGLWVGSDNMNNTTMCAGKSGLGGICFLPY